MSEATKDAVVDNVKTLVWVGGVVVACLFGIKNIVKEANEELYNKINLNQQIRDNGQDHRIENLERSVSGLQNITSGNR